MNRTNDDVSAANRFGHTDCTSPVGACIAPSKIGASAMIQALNSADGSEHDTRIMDPALIAAQAATRAIPAPQYREPKTLRNKRAVPPGPPVTQAPARPAKRRKRGIWFSTPVFILLTLALIGAAIAGFYAIDLGADPADDESAPVVDEPADDDPETDEVEQDVPAPAPDEQQPAQPDAPADNDVPPADEPTPDGDADEQPVEDQEQPDEQQGQVQDNPGQGQENQDRENPGQSSD